MPITISSPDLATVRDHLRHASITPTSVYLHSDDVRRVKHERQKSVNPGWQRRDQVLGDQALLRTLSVAPNKRNGKFAAAGSNSYY